MQSLARNITAISSHTCWTFNPCSEIHCYSENGEGELQLIFEMYNIPVEVEMIIAVSRDQVWFDHTYNRSETIVAYYSSFEVVIKTTLEHRPDAVGFQV